MAASIAPDTLSPEARELWDRYRFDDLSKAGGTGDEASLRAWRDAQFRHICSLEGIKLPEDG